MEQTLQALAGILQKAVPTALIFILLHFYLKATLFGPLRDVLKKRDELTKGARKSAQDSLAAAERKTLEFEAKLREVRNEVYAEQEKTRRQWLSDQATQLATAHQRTAGTVAKAKGELAAETAAARQSLAASSGAMADEIATSLLSRRAG
jgi:F-type H+-transporting ATPase subunit b